MISMWLNIKWACLCITLFTSIQSYKILLICPISVNSHWLWIEHFSKELLSRGHEVTAITSFKNSKPHSNYTQVVIDPPFDPRQYFPVSDILNLRYSSDVENLFLYWRVGVTLSKYALESKQVQEFIRNDDTKFDLVLAEQFFQESFLMFAHKYNTPVVMIGTLGFADYMDRTFGLLTPWSYVHHNILLYTDEMNFFQRSYNVALNLADLVLRNIYHYPDQDGLAKTYFKEWEKTLGPLPAVKDLESRIRVQLINSHRSIYPPRPSMPGLIEVGGAHVKSPKPLPENIQTFLDGAIDGAIYFSLGSYLKSVELPVDKLNEILDSFAALKQRVVWKFESDKILKIPKNVMIGKWMPQSDILAHKNVILFITHGGVFGTQEGIHRGVPMLFIPFFGDQHHNALRSQRAGYALTLNYKELTKESFSLILKEMVKNKSYYKKAKEASALFRDNPVHPMDESMFWIEYVIRNKGANHLTSAAVNLPWYSNLCWDVYVFFGSVIFSVLWIVFKIFSLLFGIIFGKNKVGVNKIKKN